MSLRKIACDKLNLKKNNQKVILEKIKNQTSDVSSDSFLWLLRSSVSMVHGCLVNFGLRDKIIDAKGGGKILVV